MLHRVFLVEELVTLIIKELTKIRWNAELDLVSLALTCRAFECPALSVLWAGQTTLSNLIRVLPQDTLAYTPLRRDTQGAWSFTEEVVRNFNPPSTHVRSRVQPHARIS